ncbi:hypothetical protein L249_6665 [Ophiocordyceps polyrhachis-furcata BCC 54312]|uniref:Uncharacterized protein n=1 Tax=Ophiocordyceps polyrhachis-furcata BCC 54312 TaxID=1330021 RepID=A0A367LJH2_9HYPO|nr:hypothetical protein L249_6665 [Ophiocordyceps polyrhachis-furcata BCC 54312]
MSRPHPFFTRPPLANHLPPPTPYRGRAVPSPCFPAPCWSRLTTHYRQPAPSYTRNLEPADGGWRFSMSTHPWDHTHPPLSPPSLSLSALLGPLMKPAQLVPAFRA